MTVTAQALVACLTGRLSVRGGGASLATLALLLLGLLSPRAALAQAPSFQTSDQFAAFEGTGLTFFVQATGWPQPTLAITAGSLPPGMTSTAYYFGTQIDGAPSSGSEGVYTVTFTATNTAGQATQVITITVKKKASIVTAPSPTFTIGQAGTATYTASGTAPVTISLQGSLPAGLVFTDNGDRTATISGTPAPGTGGTYLLAVEASNGPGASGQGFALTIQGPPSITSTAAATFTAGALGTHQITTTGAPSAALTVAGALPTGVSFTDNGNGTATMSGTPQAGSGGVYPLTITANNGFPPAATQAFTMMVDEAPQMTSAAAATMVVGQAGTFTVTTSARPTATLSVSGTLPTGVTFTDHGNGTATLAGTPAAFNGRLWPLTFTAQNGVSPDAVQSFALTVNEKPTFYGQFTATLAEGKGFAWNINCKGYPRPTLSLVGTLPPGVTFADAGSGNGVISGPSQAGTSGVWPFSIRGESVVGSSTAPYELTLLGPPRITSSATAVFTVGSAGSVALTTAGVPTALLSIVGSLPAGLSFTDNSDGTGTISGTPAVGSEGSTSVTFQASNGRPPAARQTLEVTVNLPPQVTSAIQTAFTQGQAGQFTISTAAYPTAALNLSGTLPAGLTFTDNGDGTGTISGTPTASGVFSLTIGAANGVAPDAAQSFTLTVNPPPQFGLAAAPAWTINQAGYLADLAVTGGTPPLTCVVAQGSLPPGLTLDATGIASGQPSASGVFTFGVQVTDKLGATATQTYTLTVNEAVAIGAAAAPDWTKDVPGYRFTVSGSGGTGALTWSLTAGALPAGLTLNPTTGEISGTPTAVTAASFSLTATDQSGASASRAYTCSIANPLQLDAATLPSWTVNQPGYQADLTFQGGVGPFSYAIGSGSLPPGLTLGPTGRLSGTPTATGTYTFVAGVTDAAVGNTATTSYQITVQPLATFTLPTLPGGIVGVPYQQSIGLSGGTGTVTLSLASGTLPDGLTLTNGAIQGVPSRVGSFNFVLTATDSSGAGSSQSYSITVIPADPDPARSAAVVPASGAAGSLVTIDITGRDLTGALRAGHANKFVVAVGGTNALPSPLPVSDLGNGLYRASYTPTKAGVDRVTVTVKGSAVSGTPADVTIGPGSVAASRSAMAAPSSAVAGTSVIITVTAQDSHGNAAPGQAAALAVTVTGRNAQPAPLALTDLGGGQYEATYTAAHPGADLVSVAVGNAPVAGSPGGVVVTPRPVDPTRSTVELSHRAIAADGLMTATLAVTLRDAQGVAVDGLDPTARSLQIDGLTSDQGLAVTSAGAASDAAGRYEVNFTANRRDTFTVTPTIGPLALASAELRATAWTWLRFAEGGRQFIGLPLTPLDSDPTVVLGAGSQVARWVDGESRFVGSEVGPAELYSFRPGRGLWAHLPGPLTRQVLGDAPPEGAFTLPLAAGWNNGGNPFDTNLTWDPTKIRVLRNGQDLGALSNPQLWRIAYPYVWVYDPALGRHHLVFGMNGSASTVSRHAGFWAATGSDEQGISLLLPAPATTSRRAAGPAATLRDWQIGLVASGSGQRAEVLCGSVAGLTGDLPIIQPPSNGRAALELSVVERGQRAAGSLRPAAEEWAWDLEVRSASGGPVTLSWPGLLRGLPRGLSAQLVDQASGRTVTLNTRASYQFQAAAGTVRSFRLQARVANLQRAEVTAFRVVPGRGRGVVCTLTVSGAGQVGLTVRGLGGRVVRQVAPRDIEPGQFSVTWDGLDQEGRPVPAGSFQVEATVVGPDGTISRASRTVTVR